MKSIPVFEPRIGTEEIDSVLAALKRGEISGTFGRAITEFEEQFAAYCGVRHGVAVSSGTTALEVAVAAAGIGKGDEVLVSASTNIATALGPFRNGAVPIPVDSEERTWNMDLDLIEELITPRTKAIIPVHLFGHPVDMVRLNEIAATHGLTVIEDAAEAHGALCHGKKAGSYGDMACFSFYANKVITTGEGGMVVTDNQELADQLRLLRNLAFSEPRFKHQVAGYNFRMTGYQAGMGLAQLDKIDTIIETKRRIALLYKEQLADVDWLQLPAEEEWATNVYWMFAVKVKGEVDRDQLLEQLSGAGIGTRTFFCPMNQQPFLQEQEGYRAVACPVADDMWESGFYLPSSLHISDEDIRYVCDSIRSFKLD